MSDCNHFMELASRELDGDLSQTERDELTTHVGLCHDCREKLSAYRSISEAVSELECDPPPAMLDGTFYKIYNYKKPRRLAVGRFTIAAAAVALVVVVFTGPLSTYFDQWFAQPLSDELAVSESGAASGSADAYDAAGPKTEITEPKHDTVLRAAPEQPASKKDAAAGDADTTDGGTSPDMTQNSDDIAAPEAESDAIGTAPFMSSSQDFPQATSTPQTEQQPESASLFMSPGNEDSISEPAQSLPASPESLLPTALQSASPAPFSLGGDADNNGTQSAATGKAENAPLPSDATQAAPVPDSNLPPAEAAPKVAASTELPVAIPKGYDVAVLVVVRGEIPSEFKKLTPLNSNGVDYLKIPIATLRDFASRNSSTASIYTSGGGLNSDSQFGLLAVIH